MMSEVLQFENRVKLHLSHIKFPLEELSCSEYQKTLCWNDIRIEQSA